MTWLSTLAFAGSILWAMFFGLLTVCHCRPALPFGLKHALDDWTSGLESILKIIAAIAPLAYVLWITIFIQP